MPFPLKPLNGLASPASSSWSPEELDKHFAMNSFAAPEAPALTQADVKLFQGLSAASANDGGDNYPHLSRWLRHVRSYGKDGPPDLDKTVRERGRRRVLLLSPLLIHAFPLLSPPKQVVWHWTQWLQARLLFLCSFNSRCLWWRGRRLR